MNLPYNFVESGLIFAITGEVDLQKIPYLIQDFAKQGDAFKFLTEYIDQFKSVPNKEVLIEKFPSLEVTATGNNLDYLIDEFGKQIIFRKTKDTIQKLQDDIKTDPRLALPKLIQSLDDISVKYDKDVIVYDGGSLERFDEYEDRKAQKKRGLGIIGIPTPLKAVNRSGIGWLPGQLVSIFARPTVGKTWFSIKVAAVAMKHDRRVLFISTEMPQIQIGFRMDVVYGNLLGYKLSHRKITHANLTGEEETLYKKFLTETKSKKLLVCDHVENDALSVASITGLVKKHNPDLLVIDGMYLVSGDRSIKDGWRQDNKTFQDIKNLCLSRGLATFISTQATRDAGNDLYSPPKATQVANGDALIRASDVAFSMCIRDETTDDRLIQYQKWRDDELPAQYSLLKWDVDAGNIEELDVKIGNSKKQKGEEGSDLF